MDLSKNKSSTWNKRCLSPYMYIAEKGSCSVVETREPEIKVTKWIPNVKETLDLEITTALVNLIML